MLRSLALSFTIILYKKLHERVQFRTHTCYSGALYYFNLHQGMYLGMLKKLCLQCERGSTSCKLEDTCASFCAFSRTKVYWKKLCSNNKSSKNAILVAIILQLFLTGLISLHFWLKEEYQQQIHSLEVLLPRGTHCGY